MTRRQLLQWAGRIYEWPDFDAWEREYKLEFAAELATARTQLLDGDEQWSATLLGALDRKGGNQVAWPTKGPISSWIRNKGDEAAVALYELWGGKPPVGDQQVGARIHGFLGHIPKPVAGTPGTRMNLASTLIGAFGAEDLPFVKVRLIDKAWTRLGYPVPTRGTSEDAMYLQALRNFDRFREHAEDEGFKVRDRLDAQGLIWVLLESKTDTGPFVDWSAEDIEALEEYRSTGKTRAKRPTPSATR